MDLILYSTGCPKCKVLKTKLDNKHIEYVEINDIDIMTEKGIKSVPVLNIDDNLLDFSAAVKLVTKFDENLNTDFKQFALNEIN